MRRLSNAFLTTSMIFSIVLLATWVLVGIIMFVLAGLNDVIAQGIQEGWIKVGETSDPELALAIARGILIGLGVTFIIFGLFDIPAIVVCAKARNNKSKGIHIAAIVLTALNFTYFGIAGGVLGILATNRESQSNVVDAQ